MYVAVAGLSMRWTGKDLDKMKEYVDKKNSTISYNKWCLFELNDHDWDIYQRSKKFHGCKPVVVYDPENVSQLILRIMRPDFNFVRNFGGKSRD